MNTIIFALRVAGVVTMVLAERLGFDSEQGQEGFVFSTAPMPALKPTQPLTQWVPESLNSDIKRPVSTTDNLHSIW
jgi:hypothetical protein